MINFILNEVGTILQSKFRFIPILIGDFALEKRLNKSLNANEIILLIPEVYLNKNWRFINNTLLSRSFVESSSHKHSLCRNGITVSFFAIDDFVNMTGITTKKLPREFSTFTYFLPDLTQFVTFYKKLLPKLPDNADEINYRINLLIEAIKTQTIKNTKKILKGICDSEHLTHDYTHYIRIAHTCKKLSGELGADEFICVMSALLIDVNTIPTIKSCRYKVERLLKKEVITDTDINAIISAIDEVKSDKRCKTKEAKCLSDACNLDYIGAVGIALNFAECGKKQLPMYPLDTIPVNNTEDEFREPRDTLEQISFIKSKFKKMFYTETANNIAIDRMDFMQDFLYRFYDECDGLL